MAEITATGNLGNDSKLEFTKGGTPVLSFDICDSKSRKDQNGNWETVKEQWLRVQVYGELAELLTNSLLKGTRVKVTGEFYARKYQSRDGQDGVSLDVNAWGVQVLSKGKGQPSQSSQQGWGAPPADDPWGQNQSEAPF